MSAAQSAHRPGTADKWLESLNASVLESDADGSIIETRGVIVSLRTATYTADALWQIRGVYRRLKIRNARFGSLAVYRLDRIDVRSFADEKVRTGLGALAKESEGLFHANAVIIDSPGIVAAAIRSAGSGIMLAARPKTPTRFFDRVSLGVEWLAERLSWANDPEALPHFDRVLRAMDEMCLEQRGR